MSKVYPDIDDRLAAFIAAQQMFFVATAPSSVAGHVNVSPKGLDTLRVADPRTIYYLDYVGSGAETIAHVRENGRIVIMLCAFAGAPRIVRLHGRGTVIEPNQPEFAGLATAFTSTHGARAIIRVTVNRVSDSCGFAVPLFTYEGQRPHLVSWAKHRSAEAIAAYQCEHNARSVDGLPALCATEDEPSHA
jgi:predicted pyridoxine 5'-phosphate oxidase superfamily flavin-nucleotide-binding protein